MDYEIEQLDADTGYAGFLQLKRYRLRHSRYAGGMSPVLVRERVERLRAVAVLPYDPVRDRVVLVEQFRVGALEQGPDAWLLEILGGIWDPGRSPEQVARAEAREEAGCELLELLPIGDVWISPGTSCERVRIYCGRLAGPVQGGIHGLEAEGEDIRSLVLDFADAMGALQTGRIAAATAVLALQWLALHRRRVRALWDGTDASVGSQASPRPRP
jgi:ADP-ribose pyrophosphatase